ncbi:MAG: oligosaccharide flippase family protein, partial [Nitrospinales bacterium]
MLKDFLYNFTGRIGAILIGLLRTFVVPNLLGPVYYGLLNLFGIFRTFLGFLDLGTSTAYYHHTADVMVKENAEETVRKETSNYFSTQIWINGIGITLALFIAYLLYPRYSDHSSIYITGIGSIILSHCFFRLNALARQQVLLEKRFKLMAGVTLLESAVGTLFAIIGAVTLSLVGVLIAQPLEQLVSCVAYLRKTGGIPRIRWNLKESWNILKFSFRYFYGSLSFVILRMADRILIAGLLTMESLGYYSLAHAISENVKTFIASLHEVLNPRITQKIASAEKLTDLTDEIQSQTRLLFGLILYLNANALILSKAIIYILPKFGDSIEVFRILIISLTVALFALYPSLLINSRRVGKAAVQSNATIVSSLVNVSVSYSLILMGYGIIGVAIGTLLSNILMTAFSFAYMHFYILEKQIPASYFGSMLIPFAILAILYYFRDESIWVLLTA